MDVLSTISTRNTRQTERATSTQVENSAGGFVFQLDDMARLRRFLILGAEGGTFYAGARELALDNVQVLERAVSAGNGIEVVDTIVEISRAGRAPKVQPALFALAYVASKGDDVARKYALDHLSDVARTGTHLFTFVGYAEQFRGWGRGLRRGVARWYEDKTSDDLAYQVLKYAQREGWSHRDLLRLAHPSATSPGHVALYDYISGRESAIGSLPAKVYDYKRVQSGEITGADAAKLGLSWEMLPDAELTKAATWSALIQRGMPQTALMRQLPRLTRLGVFNDRDDRNEVVLRLQNEQLLKKARVHPINVLVAQRTYASGQSARGDGTWTPVRAITDALDAAFYASFGAIEPTGKRVMLALDVSGSMCSQIAGMPLTAREASAAMALATAKVEDDYTIVGFTSSAGVYWRNDSALTELSISPRQRLDDAINAVSNLPFGGTDCALPMLHALEKGLAIDTFVVYTDNETWAGTVHPHQALRQYRERTGINARLVVVGMTSTGFSIADPKDPGMLDVVGFDSSTPSLISEFARGI